MLLCLVNASFWLACGSFSGFCGELLLLGLLGADKTGEAGKARAHHAAALELTSEIGAPLEQARAHSGLARACHADGDPAQARHHWQQALTRYTAIGAPEADEIRALLAMIADDDVPPGMRTSVKQV
jgi:hypothetical protein